MIALNNGSYRTISIATYGRSNGSIADVCSPGKALDKNVECNEALWLRRVWVRRGTPSLAYAGAPGS